MVKKINNPVKIDFLKCVVEDCLEQVKGADAIKVTDVPDTFLDCWIIEIKNKKEVQKFVKFSKEHIPENDTESLQHVKKIKVTSGVLQFIPCSSACIRTKKELQSLIIEKVAVKENDYQISDTLAKIPLNLPSSKEITNQWSEKYWPLIWRGNPNDQTLNDMEYNMDDIHKFLDLISEKSNGTESEHPIVTAFVSKTTGVAIILHDERNKSGNPLDHSVMCGIKRVSDNLPADGYLCLDYEVYTTHEPCAMCCMALVHSRISRLIYIQDMPKTGSLKSNFHIHGIKSLNSKYNVFQYIGDKYKVKTLEPDSSA